MIEELVRIGDQILESADELRYSVFVQSDEQGWSVRRSHYLIEKQIESRMRRHLQSVRGLPHFANAGGKLSNMLRAVISVQAEGHLKFVDRLTLGDLARISSKRPDRRKTQKTQ